MYEAAEGVAPNDEQRRQKLVRLIPKIDDEKVYELLGRCKTYEFLQDTSRRRPTGFESTAAQSREPI